MDSVSNAFSAVAKRYLRNFSKEVIGILKNEIGLFLNVVRVLLTSDEKC